MRLTWHICVTHLANPCGSLGTSMWLTWQIHVAHLTHPCGSLGKSMWLSWHIHVAHLCGKSIWLTWHKNEYRAKPVYRQYQSSYERQEHLQHELIILFILEFRIPLALNSPTASDSSSSLLFPLSSGKVLQKSEKFLNSLDFSSSVEKI